jgi:hypothetical protein
MGTAHRTSIAQPKVRFAFPNRATNPLQPNRAQPTSKNAFMESKKICFHLSGASSVHGGLSLGPMITRTNRRVG